MKPWLSSGCSGPVINYLKITRAGLQKICISANYFLLMLIQIKFIPYQGDARLEKLNTCKN